MQIYYYEYVANVFHPYLLKQGVPLPIILFVDGHKSHIPYDLSVLCKRLQIKLITLYPNFTRILQPADVATFSPIKEAWKNIVLDILFGVPASVIAVSTLDASASSLKSANI
jgi:hypothetical protein